MLKLGVGNNCRVILSARFLLNAYHYERGNQMKVILRLACILPFFAFGPVTQGQEYWEYDRWDQEWERHDPVSGLKYEYGNGIDVEEQGYEWESGEGYHEEEWYDPSDWFDSDDTVDYENDYNWGYGDRYDLDGYDYNNYEDYTEEYYDDDFYEEEYYFDDNYQEDYYDDYDYDYDYSNGLNDEVDYTFDQELSGEVIGLKRIRGTYGQPQSVALQIRTNEGQMRTIQLGDRAYADRYLPKFSMGDRVAIGGDRVNVNGKNMFRAKELRSGVASYRIPSYEYEQRIDGKIVGMRQVRMSDGQLGAVVARVSPDSGPEMNVLLGRSSDLQQDGKTIRPGTKITVEGYKREVDGNSTFVVQDVSMMSADNADGEQQVSTRNNNQGQDG